MITEDVMKKRLVKHEAEMAELGKQMQSLQQDIAVCERTMIHKAGEINAIKSMLAPPEAAITQQTVVGVGGDIGGGGGSRRRRR